MTLQPWMYFLGTLIILAAIVVVWFFIGRTPMRHMLSVIVRYRWRDLLDWVGGIRLSPAERRQLVLVRAYEEMFDTMLVVRALDEFFLEKMGMRWTDVASGEGDLVSDDLAGLFLSLLCCIRMRHCRMYPCICLPSVFVSIPIRR